MKDRLIQTVKALVENPEQVQINEIESAQWIILEWSELKILWNSFHILIWNKNAEKGCSF